MLTQYHFSRISWNHTADNFDPHNRNSPCLPWATRDWATLFQTAAAHGVGENTRILPPLPFCREVEMRRWKQLGRSSLPARRACDAQVERANIALHKGTRDINSWSTRRGEEESKPKPHSILCFSPGHPPAASLDLVTLCSFRTVCLNAISIDTFLFWGIALKRILKILCCFRSQFKSLKSIKIRAKTHSNQKAHLFFHWAYSLEELTYGGGTI